MKFFEELKRRNVVRVGIAYVLMGWVLLQGADFVLDLIGAPDWVIQSLALAVAVGLPITLFLSWAFELTPDGIKPESEVNRDRSITPQTGRKLDRFIIVFLAIALAVVLGERFLGGPSTDPGATATPETTEAKSIAVLPFADLSQGQDQEWFADGLAEEILNALAKTPDLLVASRTSAFKYKNSDQDIQSIAGELGVDHVLEGSVRSGAGRIRVTAQLIRASDGFHLWSQNYDRDPADMISIQEDLAVAIAGALETSLDPEALEAMAQVGTTSVDAYRALLEGLALRNQGADSLAQYEAQIKQSYEAFERARALDPGFPEAHWEASFFWLGQLSPARFSAGLSDATPQEALAAFESRLNAAISNARSDDDRMLFRSLEAQVQLRYREALDLLTRYRDAHPNDAGALFGVLELAVDSSNEPLIQQTLDAMRERAENDIDFAGGYIDRAHRYGRMDDAAALGLRWLERQPRDASLIYGTHRALLFAGRIFEARELVDRLRRQSGSIHPLMEGRQACAEGDRARVETLLAEVESDSNDISTRWQLNKFLGNEAASVEVLRPLEASGIPFLLSSFLSYPFFDPTPFPSLMTALEREGVNRPAATEIPFLCPPPERPSIAVLPFRDMSAAQDQAFFGEGIAEELLNGLARLDGLKVASRTSTFVLADQGLAIPAIAGRLAVSNVLEGSIRTSGNRVRVTAQLIDVNDDAHLWSETFDGSLEDIFAIQDDITAQILAQLEVRLTGDRPASTAETLTDNPEAYRLYLQGRQLWRQRSEDGLLEAERLLKQAIALDPDFDQAWAQLGLIHVVQPDYVNSSLLSPDHDSGMRAATRALELNPNNVEALNTLAHNKELECRWSESQDLFARALEIDPNNATTLHWLGINYGYLGYKERAREVLERGYRSDPLISSLVMIRSNNALVRGDHELAERLAIESATLGFADNSTFDQGIILAVQGKLDRLDLLDDARGNTAEEFLIATPLLKAAFEDRSKLPELERYLDSIERELNAFERDELGEMLLFLDSPQAIPFLSAKACFLPGLHMWGDYFKTTRGTPAFFRMMEEAGVVDHWRERGWPDDCASLDQSLAECPERP